MISSLPFHNARHDGDANGLVLAVVVRAGQAVIRSVYISIPNISSAIHLPAWVTNKRSDADCLRRRMSRSGRAVGEGRSGNRRVRPCVAAYAAFRRRAAVRPTRPRNQAPNRWARPASGGRCGGAAGRLWMRAATGGDLACRHGLPGFMVPLVWRATHAPRFSARRLSQLDLWSRGGATSGAQRYQDIVPREANLSDARGFDASANRAPSIGRRTMRK